MCSAIVIADLFVASFCSIHIYSIVGTVKCFAVDIDEIRYGT